MTTRFDDRREFRDDVIDRLELAKRIYDEVIDLPSVREDERRRSIRYEFSKYVQCIPLDAQRHVNGKLFVARGRDISTSGLGMVHDKRMKAGDLLAIRLPIRKSDGLDVVGKVMWCHPKDHFQAFFEFGVMFVTR